MQKAIFKFSFLVTSAIVSHSVEPKFEMPRLVKPRIRVEKIDVKDSISPVKIMSNKKTALS